METSLDLNKVTDETLVLLLWEMLGNLAREYSRAAPTTQDISTDLSCNQQLADLIMLATGVTDVIVYTGIVEVPLEHVSKIYIHLCTEGDDLWPDHNGKRLLALSDIMRKIQQRMREGLDITQVST